MSICDNIPELYGPEDPEALIPVAAGELFEWSWLTGELADWLDRAAGTTRFDFTRYFDGQGDADVTAASLAHIRARIGTLLGADRSQP